MHNFRSQDKVVEAEEPLHRLLLHCASYFFQSPAELYIQQTRGCPRGGARNSASTSRVEQPDFMYKDNCLIPDSEYDQVPQGAAKANLVQSGLYVDAFKLDKTSSEACLYVELASLFKEALSRPGLDDIG